MTTHIIVLSKDEAWSEADRILTHDIEYDSVRSSKAGYPIYYSTSNDLEYVCDLNTRLEVNLADGSTVNIWIKERDIWKELTDAAKQMGYTC